MSKELNDWNDPETTPLLKTNSTQIKSKWSITVLLSVLFIVSVSIIGYSQTRSFSSSHLKKSASSSFANNEFEDKESIKSTVSIMITNEYSRKDAPEMFAYPFLAGAYLMEPYRDSNVTVRGLEAACLYSWRLQSFGGTESTTVISPVAHGTIDAGTEVFTVATQGAGKFILSLLKQQDSSGSNSCSIDSNINSDSNSQHDFAIYVRYVRRELLSLTDRDREEFLDAMHTLWTTSTAEGKLIYGSEYKSAAYLSQIHLDGQDNGFCDQFHFNAGFFANHIYLHAYLEQSMQLVNPRTCLHYWEFTQTYSSDAFLVGHTQHQLDGGKYTEVMTAKWFGSNDPNTGRIIDGRWKNVQVPFLNADFFAAEEIDQWNNFFPENNADFNRRNTFPHSTNPYGFLRSVWNYNPSPYLARYNSIGRIPNVSKIAPLIPKNTGATCDMMYSWMKAFANRPLTHATNAMQYLQHTEAHWTPGGFGGEQGANNDRVLREKFAFTDAMIAETTSIIGQARRFDTQYLMPGNPRVFNCTNLPYDYITGTLKFNTPPGEEGGVQCKFLDHFYESETNVNQLFDSLFTASTPTTTAAIASYSLQQKIELMRVLEWRFSYPGELSVSSAVTDPMFWVIHSPFERVFQLLVFKGAFSSLSYDTKSNCAGHDADTPKHWLSGYYLADKFTDAGTLPLHQLQDLLNPLSQQFETLQSYVYDSAEWPWCPELLSTLEEAMKKTTVATTVP